MAKVTLAGLRQYVEDFEVGLTLRLDALEARLASMETDLAIIKEHLVTQVHTAERDPDPDTPLQRDLEEAVRLGESRIDPRFVAARLGLTRVQSEVAVLLAEGHSVRDIAAAIRSQLTTVRWHLKMINRKLNIQRQTQLVRLVLLLPNRKSNEGENDLEGLEDARETN